MIAASQLWPNLHWIIYWCLFWGGITALIATAIIDLIRCIKKKKPKSLKENNNRKILNKLCFYLEEIKALEKKHENHLLNPNLHTRAEFEHIKIPCLKYLSEIEETLEPRSIAWKNNYENTKSDYFQFEVSMFRCQLNGIITYIEREYSG